MKFQNLLNLFLVLLLLSCTPQKRLSRLIKHHPELLTQTDTVRFTDTITVTTPFITKDSVFLISKTKDTIIIQEKNLTIKTYIKGDTVYVSGECDTVTVTVIKEHNIPYRVVEYKNKLMSLKEIVFLIFLFSIILFLALFLLNKINKT